jgi:hypothetical protein
MKHMPVSVQAQNMQVHMKLHNPEIATMPATLQEAMLLLQT